MNISARSINGSFAGEVQGVDVAAGVSPEDIEKIKVLISQYPVLCFRNQRLTDEQQMRFASSFGPLLVNQYAELGGREDGSKQTIDIATVDENGVPIEPQSMRGMMNAANALWHTDGSHSNPPVRYTILSARNLPKDPPDTEYANMRKAWDDLPAARKAELDGLLVEHSILVSRAKMGMKASDFTERAVKMQPPTNQPLVRTDPISGRKSLYLASHASHIVGRPLEEGRKVIEELYAFATEPSRRYSHKWLPYDLVMWDDFSTMHRATPYDRTEPRILRWAGVMAPKQAA
jgi:alpha-ketoglutarate-dependent 2,4-dichlorophenoxyacetate dioxygenase